MGERILSPRALNRALLARQRLLERARLPIPRAVEAVGGLQAQYAPSGYLGLWSRLAGFERDALTRALERRTVVQASLMRDTIHVTSPGDFQRFAAGIRGPRRAWWLRVTPGADDTSMRRTAARLRAILADGPLRRSEIVERLGVDAHRFNGAGLWVDLVRVPPSGTWEHRRADRYALAEAWLGIPPENVTPLQGVAHLVRRYLGAFGPAARTDIATWAGLPRAALDPAVADMSLRRFRDEAGTELLDLPRAPLPDPDAPAPVRFLPTWDATLLVHARRSQILPDRYRARVFHTRTPHSVPTFLIDGQVAGTWSFGEDRVHTQPFGHLAPAVRRELAEEGERLAAFMR